MLRVVSPAAVLAQRRDPVDAATRAAASTILDDVRTNGEKALIAQAIRLGDIKVWKNAA